MDDTASEAFEVRARSLLSQYPTIRHEWRPVVSRLWGNRLDLVCNAGSPDEVWATLRGDSIAVGDAADHSDFETFGRNVSRLVVAQEALDRFVALLRNHGYPEAAA